MGPISPEGLINDFTAEEWENFTAQYIANELQAPATPPASVSAVPAQATASTGGSLRVYLKDFPITTGKACEWPKYRCKFIATTTANEHEEVLSAAY